MFRIFYFGIFCGALAAAGVVWFVPAVDQHREPSLISVEANGGNREVFHINLPQDRILAGMAGVETVPAGLEWPASGTLADAQAELFKIRDAHDIVVGVASRMAGSGAATGSVIEWTLHLPARGSLYATMQPAAGNDGYRSGTLRAGTREFADLGGRVFERYYDVGEAAASGLAIDSRIELVTALVSTLEPDE
ncbi:MAG TPA: hypothetical protein VFG91_08745 [Woeseiaceae bacterium]|nr:hypothetical protein [Woeseiaceae bacterium]